MMTPSRLEIATSALHRLAKEDESYYRELEQQKARLRKLEEHPDEENGEYLIAQQKKAIAETEGVMPTMKANVNTAIKKLEDALEVALRENEASEQQITKARETITEARQQTQTRA